MRKIHCKVVLDVYLTADDDIVDIIEELNEAGFEPGKELNDGINVINADIISSEVTDSR